MSNKIRFIAADESGIKFFAGEVGNCVGFAKTPKMVAYILKTKGIADTLLHSSSMDFASEYGFKKDGDAWKLFDAGIELI
tara:strand:- start:83 stop:322 length:240 start_codon:yes stop_codon:yes gene_type:complete